MRIRPSVLGPVVWTAVVVTTAACGTAGDRPPAGAPAEVAPSADATSPPGESPAAAPDNSSATTPLPTAAPMPAQARRQGTAPDAAATPPAANSISTPGAAPEEAEPPPPPPEIEVQWTVDDAIPTPDDLPAGSVLAKFKAPDGASIIVYKKGDRVIRRRIRTFGGGWSYLVDELDIDDRPPGWKAPAKP